ncbi:MAG: SBBP repeat-containing protein [Bacteroidetes bacterium]|nr:SBBP repeat-containing protein [Bacteroidota bacterium]
MKHCLGVAVAAVFCYTLTVTAQVKEVWSARFNGAGNLHDGINAMAIDDEGNVYVAGSNGNGLISGNDFCTIKYTPSGDTAWVRIYNGTGNNTDIARAIAVDTNGNVYVTGESRNGSEFGTEDYVIIKYSPNGDSLWVKRYDGTGANRDMPKKIGLDDSANVYVTGLSMGANNAMDITTIKYTADGVEQWVRRWSGDATYAFSNDAQDMAVTGSGNVYLTGHVNNQTTFWDFVTLKYNRDGVKQWHAYYAGPNNSVSEEAKVLAVDANENVYVAGSNSQYPNAQPVIIKYNAEGIQQWKTVLLYDYHKPKAMAVDKNNNIYVGFDEFTLMKFSAGGDSLWSRRIGTTNVNHQISALAVGADGKIFSVGRISSPPSTDYNFLTVQYDTNGDTAWTMPFNGTANGNDEPSVLKLGNDGAIYVAGYSTSADTKGDMYVIKYSETGTAVRMIHAVIPAEYSLSQNYPNPFNPATTIRYHLAGIEHAGKTAVSLTVIDLLGREIAVLVNAEQTPGMYEVMFNASSLSSGVYFYHLRTGNFSEIKRMMLIK